MARNLERRPCNICIQWTVFVPVFLNYTLPSYFFIELSMHYCPGIDTSVADPWHFGTDPDPDPAIFAIDLQEANKKLFFSSFSPYYFLKLQLHNFSKIKDHKEVTKQQESRFFLSFLLDDRRIWIRSLILTSDRRAEAQKYTDPNPGLQHWQELFQSIAGIILVLSRYSSMFSTIYTQKTNQMTRGICWK